MRLINTNILFKPFPNEEKLQSGLFVPESFQEVNNKGIVMATGHKVTKVKTGDIVFRCKNWGEEMIVDGEKVFFMDERAILAKL